MVFWIGILVAAGFAWFAIKQGFYEIWAMLFNIIISIYLAIFAGPLIIELVPASGEMPYGNIVAIVVTGVASFLILHGLSYIFFTNQFSVPVPRVFDVIGAGFLGFLSGLLVWSFVALLVYLTPVAQQDIAKQMGVGKSFAQSNISYVSWWCDQVNSIVAYKNDKYSTSQAIEKMIKTIEAQNPQKPSKKMEPNTPADINKPTEVNKPAEPNAPKQDTPKQPSKKPELLKRRTIPESGD
jgi:hypothetical protein